MNRIYLLLPLALALMTSLGAGAPQARAQVKQYAVEDFFRTPDQSGFALSPNGQYVLMLKPYEKRKNVFVQKIGETATTQLTKVTDRDLAVAFWKGDEHVLYLKDNGGDENWRLYSVGIDGKGEKALTPENVVCDIVDQLDDHPTDVLISLNERNPQLFDVYRLNVVTGERKLVAENPGNITGWITDHTGAIRIAMTTDGVNTGFMFREKETDAFKQIKTYDFRTTVAPIFFTFDNKNVYALSNENNDKTALIIMDPRTGKQIEQLYVNPDFDIDGVEYSEKRKVLTYATFSGEKTGYKFFDKTAEDTYNKLVKLLPGQDVFISSENKAEDRLLVRAFSDKSLGSVHLYDVKTNKLTKLADYSPWINPADMADMKPVKYTARDGLTIHAYLTLPKGKPAKNLATVILVHGGPWARDSWGWQPEVQMLANRGYAVLQVNYRGSTGYGRKFWEASFGQWGLRMQDDLTDGVKWLIEQGIADPKRVGIYGGSYGGYATLAGLAFTPDLYACGVDYVGVSNLFTFMETIPPYWEPYLEMMYVMVGHPEKDKDRLTATSPALNVDKIKAPLFVAQGAKDPRVNIDESDQIVNALKARGIDVPYLVKENEGHGFRNEENRYEFYNAMLAFLNKHLKPNE